MVKKSEFQIILKNIKDKLVFFISLNVLVLISFFFFYENTKTIKNEFIPIKLVTDDFPTVTDMMYNFKFYIEFVTDYELDVANRTFTSSVNKTLSKNEIYEYLDEYMDNYHNSVISLKESIRDNELQAQVTNSIDFYFQKIKLFDRVYKLGDIYSKYKYEPINYLTIIFSLILFFNFLLYLIILTIDYVKKNK